MVEWDGYLTAFALWQIMIHRTSPSFIRSAARHLERIALVADRKLMRHYGSTGKLWSDSTQVPKDTCSSKYIKFYWQYNTQYIALPLAWEWRHGESSAKCAKRKNCIDKRFPKCGLCPLRGHDWFSGRRGGMLFVWKTMLNKIWRNIELHCLFEVV
jgi:hypothetical protein